MKRCECGCGNPTPIAQKTRTKLGHIKGQPVRFVHGHSTCAPGSRHWRFNKSGRTVSRGYVQVRAPKHPHANSWGFVHEHIMVASDALGKPLPPKACVHHVNGDRSDNRPSNLVVCESHGYHMLLHVRERQRNAGGK